MTKTYEILQISFKTSIWESILIKITFKNIDRKKIIFLRGSKEVKITINEIVCDNIEILND